MKAKAKIICCILCFICCFLGGIVLFYHPDIKFSLNEQFYIAHGGGEIDGHQKTNSKEAILNSINHGLQYIEIDLGITSDGHLVGVHDWENYKLITNYKDKNDLPLSKAEFVKQKIHSKYTPVTLDDIKDFLNEYPNLKIVTDKISEPTIINNNFHEFKDRIVVECFSEKDYLVLTKLGYRCYRSRVPEPKLLYFFKYLLSGANQRKYAGSIEVFEQRNKNFLLAPPEVETALFSCQDIETADSLFALYPNVKFI